MQKDYLLNSEKAKKLYKQIKDLPIIDYHNHLSVDEIKENKRFTDVYDLWIKPDPYKHRAMRMCGIEEKYITGEALPKEKFIKWYEALPSLIGNPLYIWSLMELQAVFNMNEIPDKNNAEKIYNACNEFLKNNIITVNSLLEKFGIEKSCPCVSLIDDITFFENSSNLSPSLRGDDIVKPTTDFIKKLENESDIKIATLFDFENAIRKRLLYFKKIGCVFTDHAIDNGFKFYYDDGQNESRFIELINKKISKI